MKITKVLEQAEDYLNTKNRKRKSKIKCLKFVLKKLRKREKKLEQKCEEGRGNQEKISNELAIIHAQRSKGVSLLQALEEEHREEKSTSTTKTSSDKNPKKQSHAETKIVSVIFGDELANYHFGEEHPFGPKRYWAFKEEFEQRNLSAKVNLSSPQICLEKHLRLFHTNAYIDKVKVLSESGTGYLDAGDTPACQGIYEAACGVVGSTLKAIDLIMQGDTRQVFTPIAGLHHARRDSAAGFCVFNDCGIAIEYLRHEYHIQRVAYVDIDAHHGDGVFYSFEEDKDLIFVDLHQDGNTLYPGTGFINETGKGDAAGTKLNVPLPPGCTDNIARKFWKSAEQFLEKAKPDFILLQCGADSLAGDPITQLELSAEFHRYVASRLSQLAKKYSRGRLLAMGGGGYNLENIKAGWNGVIEGLLES